jgi:hypothetical protein
MKNHAKYNTARAWLKIKIGPTKTFAPKYPKLRNDQTNKLNERSHRGLYFGSDGILGFSDHHGNINKINIAPTIAAAPPSLLGIDLRIA